MTENENEVVYAINNNSKVLFFLIRFTPFKADKPLKYKELLGVEEYLSYVDSFILDGHDAQIDGCTDCTKFRQVTGQPAGLCGACLPNISI